MIKYNSHQKYSKIINALNKKYNDIYFKLNHRKVAGYDDTEKKWFFDENVVRYSDYLPYANFTPEQENYLKNFYINLPDLYKEIDSKINLEDFNAKYRLEGDVYSAYTANGTTVIKLTDSAKGTETLRVVYFKSISAEKLHNTRIVVIGSLSVYKNHGEFQIIAEAIYKTSKKTKYQEQIDTWHTEIFKKNINIIPHKKQYSFPDIQYMGVISSNERSKGYTDFKAILQNTDYVLKERFIPLTAENIAAEIQAFYESESVDCICIVRGGGNKYDLLDFNNPTLIEAMHDSYMFIFTAIGHTTDELLCNKFSNYNAATPTALATYLRSLQWKYINAQKKEQEQNELLSLTNKNTQLEEQNAQLDKLVRELRTEKNRLKESLDDVMFENERLREELKESNKGFFRKLFG